MFSPTEIASKYTTYRLQLKLQKHFGESLVVETQQGQRASNLVYSSSVSMVEAIQTAHRLKVEKDSMKLETSIVNDENIWNSHYDEHEVHYAAASILRKAIENVEFPDDKYSSSESVSLENSVHKMLLTSFICWLLDDDAFTTTSKEECKLSHEKQRKCLALSECIVAIYKNSFIPFHLGVALQMYHLHGSKNLIETLNAHGFCASYSEVRRFLTSIADSEINKIEHDTYVPNGILPFNESFALIQEGADNVDINTETIDEKDTFHRWQELYSRFDHHMYRILM